MTSLASGGVRLLLFANPVLAPLSDDMKNSSCIRRSLPPWNAFYAKGRFPVK